MLLAARFSNWLTAGLLISFWRGLNAQGVVMATYTQKRVSARTAFAFGDTQLSYSMRFGASVHEIVADYFQIARSRRHTSRRDWARLRSGCLLSLFGLTAMTVQAMILGATPWMTLWLAPGLALIAAFVIVRGHYLELSANGEPFWVIDNKSTRTIVAEIDRRRRDQLAVLYGALNLANEPYLEIRKVNWLVEEAVFTREEADLQIDRIHAYAAEKAEARAEQSSAREADVFAREALAI